MSRTESEREIFERVQWDREPGPALAPSLAIAVTGGRDLTPGPLELGLLIRLLDALGVTELHHGDCRGTDRIAAAHVRRQRPSVKIVAHSADWNEHGKAAGPIRNRTILSWVRILVAFPGGRGTTHCVAEARRQGRRVLFVQNLLDKEVNDLERDLLLLNLS